MSIGNLRNRPCVCGKFPAKKYSECCWDKDYWKDFSKSVIKVKEKEVICYRRSP